MVTNTLNSELFISDPAAYLSDLLIERKQKNKNYSARAMARDLGISQAFLSQVLNKTRKISLQQKVKLANHLGISLNTMQLNTRTAASKKKLDLVQYHLEHDKILKYWYHFAILEMTQTESLTLDSKKVGQRLGISEIEARSAIHRLMEFGYLMVTRDEKLKRTSLPFVINAARSSLALREFHQCRLTAAINEINDGSDSKIQNRHFQTLFLPTSKERVKKAKSMALEFQKQLIEFLMEGTPNEVFQLSLQLFSIESKKQD